MFAAASDNPAGSRVDDRLFRRIGDFLLHHLMEPSPTNYALAFHILVNPEGPLARAVDALTKGGGRLNPRDVESLGANIDAEVNRQAPQGLIAQTRGQVEGFEHMMQAIRVETAGFGRDLKASAAALRDTQSDTAPIELEAIVRITAGMLERVQQAETQLEKATREASELRSKLEEARNDARHDPLTRLPNRRAMEDAYDARIAAGEAPWVAICDIDYFKAVNDRFGHAVGDRVLKAIAMTLTEQCPGHLVARYGGEEFAVMFTGPDAGDAFAILNSARNAVAAKRYRLRENDQPLGIISFSAGLARAAPGEDWAGIYQRADRLLYRAKSDGRNRVVSEINAM
ncbi:GGDEF domain-containing protein [Stakelama sp. CBK3Z-3]|uniref:diguanylate cyclase n=1 Tax=Stakelama flava TaxID=2860338 RepID=A0ABS6XIM6_9SPHN|nr:GGDEF domain-containing protein [Stakelama flava]MBW4329991.1 GGDEF domain-containing protein [Stakelama flava]